ncbi:MAG: DUF1002 domain-containing protein [Lachnospiraceae bacterium]|nr:DUF1002 domain-containing protein [Lachnospiraceae bacterium]
MIKIVKGCYTALAVCVLAATAPVPAKADAIQPSAFQVADQTPEDDVNEDTKYDKYIAFGADLKPSEKTSVLNIFGLTEAGLSDYKTIEVTNKDEHDYLGSYLDSSVIGTRALSSVMVVKTEEGSGIFVSTNNVNYCTSGMYCNALITAGLSDAKVTVAAPFNISGTSALVGAMKAYSVMTGQDIPESTMDTATDELVTTAEVAESIGDDDKVVQLVAAAKQKIFEEELSSLDDIRDAVEASAEALKINIKEEDVEKLATMLKKVSEVDIDVNAIKEQASEIYNKLKDAGIDFSKVDTKGLAEKVGDFFANIFNAIKDFFSGLFG